MSGKTPKYRFRQIQLIISIVVAVLIFTAFVVSYAVQRRIYSRNNAQENYAPTADYYTRTQPVDTTKPVFRLTIDAKTELTADNAFARVVLVDRNDDEYLVYETYAAISAARSSSVTDACEETCILDGITPKFLRIEGQSSNLVITKTAQQNEQSGIQGKIKTQDIAQAQTTVRSQANAKKIDTLNTELKKSGKRWTAGETDISKLTYAQKKKLFITPGGKPVTILPNLQGFEYYKGGIFDMGQPPVKRSPSGLIPQNADPLDFDPTTLPAVTRPAWDWRTAHGKNWITPVKDQLWCASCWAFAAIAATEAMANITYNGILNLDLSEQDAICRHSGSCSNGGYTEDTFNDLKNSGLVTEQCYPYSGNEMCTGRCARQKASTWRISGFQSLTSWPPSDNEIKYMLITKGPLTFGIASWWHYMLLAGYEKDPESDMTVFIVKNSWGPSWRENGYGKMTVSEYERYGINSVTRPYLQKKPNLYKPVCTDADRDRFCTWGSGNPKPKSCKLKCNPVKDCDDADPHAGGFDANLNCIQI